VTLRVVFNRDERRDRPPADTPRVVVSGNRRAVYPLDPEGGGTWLAATDAGLVFALLNRTARAGQREAGTRSRGLIIPSLVGAESIDDAILQLREIPASTYAPFRVIALSTTRWAEGIADSRRVRVRCGTIENWIIRTSSSLGDQRVARRRRVLADDLLRPADDRVAVQDRLHRHRWPHAPHLSVWMERADALTVSRSTIELTNEQARFVYEPLHPPGQKTEVTLPLKTPSS
jgi:uncharacterized protein with NRDE domain